MFDTAICVREADRRTPIRTERPRPSVSVVIPALNEADNLYHILPHLPSIVSEVVLVDGRSRDDTIAVAEHLMPDIRVVNQKGKGKGSALREGFAACTGDIIVMLDADGSADPNEIPRFVDALLQGNDFAKGSRFIAGGGSEDITIVRGLGNYVLSSIVNILFHTRFSDLCYGYNAFWRYCIDKVEVDCDGFEVETLLNLRMHKARLTIAEVPSFERRRIYGESNLNVLRDGWRVLKTIAKERLQEVLPISRPRGPRLMKCVLASSRWFLTYTIISILSAICRIWGRD